MQCCWIITCLSPLDRPLEKVSVDRVTGENPQAGWGRLSAWCAAGKSEHDEGNTCVSVVFPEGADSEGRSVHVLWRNSIPAESWWSSRALSCPSCQWNCVCILKHVVIYFLNIWSPCPGSSGAAETKKEQDTLGEEVERVNGFLWRTAVCSKHMTRGGKCITTDIYNAKLPNGTQIHSFLNGIIIKHLPDTWSSLE